MKKTFIDEDGPEWDKWAPPTGRLLRPTIGTIDMGYRKRDSKAYSHYTICRRKQIGRIIFSHYPIIISLFLQLVISIWYVILCEVHNFFRISYYILINCRKKT